MEQITPDQLRLIIAASVPTPIHPQASAVEHLANAALLVLNLFAEACLKDAEARK